MTNMLDDLIEEARVEEFKKDTETFFTKVKNRALKVWLWIKNNKLIVSLCLVIVVLLGILATVITNPSKFGVKVTDKEIIEKIVYKDNPQDIIMSKNWLVKNLDEMQYTKTRLVKSALTKEDLIGVWRKVENTDGNSIYVAIFEPVKNMKYNKKEYDRYMEDNKEKETLLSK